MPSKTIQVNMRAANSLPVDDDIADRVLTFSVDSRTLDAITLSSKHLRAVFEDYPYSINGAVAPNAIGPVLPQALRLIRYPFPEPHASKEDEDDCRDFLEVSEM
ncbi:hypothetical protein B0H10DRAFT_2031096, partial [Mycena sp. CBHHK59/15]